MAQGTNRYTLLNQNYMVRLKGPLFSQEARKQLGKSLIFKTKGNRAFLTKYNKPGGVKKFTPSDSQLAKRSWYGQAVAAWRVLSEANKKLWRDLAKGKKLSGWNLFLKQYTIPPLKEDFTTYIEEDPNSKIAVTTSRVTAINLGKNEIAYLCKDKEVNHFNGDFEHLLTLKPTGYQAYATIGFWGLTNDIGDFGSLYTAGKNFLICDLCGVYGQANKFNIRLKEFYNGVYGDEWIADINTLYYLRIKRVEADGDYGTIYCDIYTSEADRINETNASANLSLILHAKQDLRYIYGISSWYDGWAEYLSCYVENLYLQE